MKVTLSARHFDASEKLRAFAENEVDRLSRYYDGRMSAEVILDESGNLKTVEMRLTVFGKVLPVRIEGSDFYKLIPKAVEKLEQQLRSVKSKVVSR